MARFGQTEAQCRTNFTLGHDGKMYSSTYDRDFNPHVMRTKDNIKLLNTYNKLFASLPHKHGNDDDGFKTMSKKSPRIQPTHITFGNDENCSVEKTAYQEFTSSLSLPQRRRVPFPTPTEAQMFPCITSPQPASSCVNHDYRFFGNKLNRNVYNGRIGDLRRNNTQHTHDSVAMTLLGRRRKMLTVSMMDYKNPLDRVKGNIKSFMVHEISPSVRKDSLWLKDVQSSADNKTSKLNPGSRMGNSENKVNFSWPDKEKGMKLFYNQKTR